MKPRILVVRKTLPVIAAFAFAHHVRAAVLVDLDATALAPGAISAWENKASAGGGLTNATPIRVEKIQNRAAGRLKMRDLHRCWRCGEPALHSLCATHLVQERERQRRISGYSTRDFKALSYIFVGADQPGLE